MHNVQLPKDSCVKICHSCQSIMSRICMCVDNLNCSYSFFLLLLLLLLLLCTVQTSYIQAQIITINIIIGVQLVFFKLVYICTGS